MGKRWTGPPVESLVCPGVWMMPPPSWRPPARDHGRRMTRRERRIVDARRRRKLSKFGVVIVDDRCGRHVTKDQWRAIWASRRLWSRASMYVAGTVAIVSLGSIHEVPRG